MSTSATLGIVREQLTLREPCKKCGATEGHSVIKGGQDVAYCTSGHYAYCVPKTESGRPTTSKRTRRDIPPSQRARILLRDGGACVLCHRRDLPLELGHLLSVKAGKTQGLGDEVLYSDENLAAMCESCNAGISEEPVPLRIAAAILLARADQGAAA